jgi:transposase-like protein
MTYRDEVVAARARLAAVRAAARQVASESPEVMDLRRQLRWIEEENRRLAAAIAELRARAAARYRLAVTVAIVLMTLFGLCLILVRP